MVNVGTLTACNLATYSPLPHTHPELFVCIYQCMVCVCVCVCVRVHVCERDRERETETEKKRGGSGEGEVSGGDREGRGRRECEGRHGGLLKGN